MVLEAKKESAVMTTHLILTHRYDLLLSRNSGVLYTVTPGKQRFEFLAISYKANSKVLLPMAPNCFYKGR